MPSVNDWYSSSVPSACFWIPALSIVNGLGMVNSGHIVKSFCFFLFDSFSTLSKVSSGKDKFSEDAEWTADTVNFEATIWAGDRTTNSTGKEVSSSFEIT